MIFSRPRLQWTKTKNHLVTQSDKNIGKKCKLGADYPPQSKKVKVSSKPNFIFILHLIFYFYFFFVITTWADVNFSNSPATPVGYEEDYLLITQVILKNAKTLYGNNQRQMH